MDDDEAPGGCFFVMGLFDRKTGRVKGQGGYSGVLRELHASLLQRAGWLFIYTYCHSHYYYYYNNNTTNKKCIIPAYYSPY